MWTPLVILQTKCTLWLLTNDLHIDDHQLPALRCKRVCIIEPRICISVLKAKVLFRHKLLLNHVEHTSLMRMMQGNI